MINLSFWNLHFLICLSCYLQYRVGPTWIRYATDVLWISYIIATHHYRASWLATFANLLCLDIVCRYRTGEWWISLWLVLIYMQSHCIKWQSSREQAAIVPFVFHLCVTVINSNRFPSGAAETQLCINLTDNICSHPGWDAQPQTNTWHSPLL